MTTPYLREILGPHTDKTLSELDQYTVCYGECARSFRDVAERDIPKWDSLDADQRAAEIARIDHEADERAKAHDDERMRSLEEQWQPPSDDELIGWHDVTRSADYWFDPEQVVSPEQAAMLMVGWNPLTDGAPDTSKSDDDPEKLKQYRLFKFRFESAEIRDSKPRTLREWVPLAMDAGLNKSAWVNEYMALTDSKADLDSAGLNRTEQADDMAAGRGVVQLNNPPSKQAGRVEHWLVECETRAAVRKLPFDRRKMPGTKDDFLVLLHALDADLWSCKTKASINRYLKGRCAWPGGKQESELMFYASLFPEASLKRRAVAGQRLEA